MPIYFNKRPTNEQPKLIEVFEVQRGVRISKRTINSNNNSVVCEMVAYDVAVVEGQLNWCCGEVTD
jgi:hypothetical protein